MSSIGENLRTFIVGSTSLSTYFDAIDGIGTVEQNTIRQDAPSPRIWYQRNQQSEDLDVDGTGGLVESTWDIEVHSESPDGQSLDIADVLKARLHGHKGAFGDQSVQGVFVEDHDDDYLPKGVASEDGLYVAALSAKIFFATT
jgi:hypothetical protein